MLALLIFLTILVVVGLTMVSYQVSISTRLTRIEEMQSELRSLRSLVQSLSESEERSLGSLTSEVKNLMRLLPAALGLPDPAQHAAQRDAHRDAQQRGAKP